jgi:TolA-binding protein
MSKLLLILPFLFVGCFKTTEEIERERLFQEQLNNSQKFDKDFLVQMNDFKSKVDQYNGRMEDIEFKQNKVQQDTADSLKQIQAQLDEMKRTHDKNQKQIAELRKEVKDQKKFLEKVTKSLKGIKKKSSEKKGGALADLKKADGLFKKKKFKQAKSIYEELVESKKLRAAKNNAALLNLGIIEYNQKNYDESLVYLSKIYTKWPKSSKSPSALYHIGLNFKAQGLKDEAKQTFKTVIEKYPKSSFAKKAKNEL